MVIGFLVSCWCMKIAPSLALPPPLTLRGVRFDPPLFCAPMADITHSAFRRLVADFGGYGALYTEMLPVNAVLHEDLQRSPWLRRRPEEGRVIYQLLVDSVEGLPECLARLARLRPDGIDLNCGCAAPKVLRRGGGAALFDDIERLRGVVRVMRCHTEGPLLVKLRLGRQTADWRTRLGERLRLLEDEGVDAVTIQPRFSEEPRGRRVRHELYGELVAETTMPVIANGDIGEPGPPGAEAAPFGPVAGLMIGRLAVAQPWIFARWHDPDIVVNPAHVWLRLCDYIAEDFEPNRALARLKIVTPYLACNFVYGHELFRAVQSCKTFSTARETGAAFLAGAPKLREHISVNGI